MQNEKICHDGRQAAPRQDEHGSSRVPGARRRPYQRPRILERQPIEAVAAVCSVPGGKNDPTCLVGFS
jgi:hypothetical protein